MRWDQGYRSNDVDDRRGEPPVGGAGGGLPVGNILAVASRFGWKGILIALVVIGGITYGGVCTGGGTPSHVASRSVPSASDDQLAHFVGFVFDDVQKTWARDLPGYQKTRLELFHGSIKSACGTATEAVGPFYCPTDRKVYIDLAFYDELRRRFGAPGDFAQAYVIAHEVGHHVQNLHGLMGRGSVDQIHLELQADCLAGAWAKDADGRGIVEVGDIDEALNAATQIGDDTIQRKTQGRVQPETWTHGSGAQRSGSFRQGFTGGPAACGIR
jgi:predicted metalloprotease